VPNLRTVDRYLVRPHHVPVSRDAPHPDRCLPGRIHTCKPTRPVRPADSALVKMGSWQPPSTVGVMPSDEFVPVSFDPPTSLVTSRFRLEPLGPQHNQADHAAWTSSIEHIRSTPGYPNGNWPPRNGMTLEQNLADLRRHAADFAGRAGFTFTVLDPGDNDVIGCAYLYPPASDRWDVTVQSWVRADRAGLDTPLADAVASWLATDWPWERVDRCGR
jgi:hypothetical protein